MAAFRGIVKGNRGEASRCGSAKSGLVVEAASWDGKVVVSIWKDKSAGGDMCLIELRPHHGHGISHTIYRGRIDGKPELVYEREEESG